MWRRRTATLCAGGRSPEAFDALRRKFKSESWYKDVHGDFVFVIMPLDRKQIIDAISHEFSFIHTTPFRYEPMPTLRASTTPQLWVLGSDDLEAPSAETAKRIKSLIAQGKSYTLAVYPGAEHGMTEYELNAKGERVSTRFAPGYFQMMANFIRDGRIGEHYGNAEITRPVAPTKASTNDPTGRQRGPIAAAPDTGIGRAPDWPHSNGTGR
jgi:hypothetical protein